jgi:hypothetical protein
LKNKYQNDTNLLTELLLQIVNKLTYFLFK